MEERINRVYKAVEALSKELGLLTFEELDAYSELEAKYYKLKAAASDQATELTKLADDEDPLIRFQVARNLNTPKEVLEQLRNDTNIEVRKQAEETCKIA